MHVLVAHLQAVGILGQTFGVQPMLLGSPPQNPAETNPNPNPTNAKQLY